MSPKRCGYCGAEPGEPCRDSFDAVVADHYERRRSGRSARADARRDEAARIEAGGLCAQERAMRGDEPRLDAWRVRVVCACLARCEWRRGEAVASRVLERWPWPTRLALAYPHDLADELHGIGLTAMREGLIRAASIAAAHNDVTVAVEGSYSRDAVLLCVLRDTSARPTDFALRAVRRRLTSSRQGELST